MNKQIKSKWLKALRSNEYVQGQDALCTTNSVDKFCCLGVLCDVRAGMDKSLGWEITKVRDEDPNELVFLGQSLALSSSMLKWAGLTGEEQDELAEMNDSGKSFSKIANFIEETL